MVHLVLYVFVKPGATFATIAFDKDQLVQAVPGRSASHAHLVDSSFFHRLG